MSSSIFVGTKFNPEFKFVKKYDGNLEVGISLKIVVLENWSTRENFWNKFLNTSYLTDTIYKRIKQQKTKLNFFQKLYTSEILTLRFLPEIDEQQ